MHRFLVLHYANKTARLCKQICALTFYDEIDNLDFGLMFHSFGYPEETGKLELASRFWMANMQDGVIEFPSIDDTEGRLKTRFIRKMQPEKPFKRGENVKPVEDEAKEVEL